METKSKRLIKLCEMEKEPVMVHIVKDDGTVIQRVTPEDFMKAVGAGREEFLQSVIDRYNKGIAAKGTKAVTSIKKNEQIIKYHGYKECPQCKGKGHVPAGGGVDQCGYCKGSGMVLAKKPQLVNLGSQERPVTPSKGKKNFTKDPSFL